MLRCVMRSVLGAVGLSCGVSSAQPIEWLNPVNGFWDDPASWTGGQVPDTPGEQPILGLAGPYTVTSTTDVSHGTLTISNPDVLLLLNSNITHTIHGDLRNNGEIFLRGSSLEFQDANARLEGTGTLELSTATSQLIAHQVTVTHAAGHTIMGSGQLTANAPGGWRNGGTIVAESANGTGIELDAIVLEQLPGASIGADSGKLILANGAGILGGELRVMNGGSFEIVGVRGTLENVTVFGRVELDQADVTLALDGSIDLRGEIALNPGGTADNAALRFDTDATISGPGEIILRQSGFAAGQLRCNLLERGTIGAGVTVRGSGEINSVIGVIVNSGVIVADDPAEPLRLKGDLEGSGLFGAQDGTLLLESVDLVGVTLNTQGTGVVTVEFATLTGSRNEGALEMLADAELEIFDGCTNNGTISQPLTDDFTSPLVLREGATLDGDGALRFFDSVRSGIFAYGGGTAIGPDQTVFGAYGLYGLGLSVQGTLEPETDVKIQGDVVLAPGSVVRMEIAEDAGDSDQIEIARGGGMLTLGGTLVIELDPGFVPASPQTWLLIDGEPGVELFGAFDTIVVPDGPPGFTYEVEEVATGIRVIAFEDDCPADFNGDGTVNTLDVLAFLNAWSAGDPSADFNGDGSVNTLDVLSFLNAWAAGC